jgi:hypothetical protein
MNHPEIVNLTNSLDDVGAQYHHITLRITPGISEIRDFSDIVHLRDSQKLLF